MRTVVTPDTLGALFGRRVELHVEAAKAYAQHYYIGRITWLTATELIRERAALIREAAAVLIALDCDAEARLSRFADTARGALDDLLAELLEHFAGHALRASATPEQQVDAWGFAVGEAAFGEPEQPQ